MNFNCEKNKEDFLNKLTSLQNAINNRKLVSDRLEVVEKNGFKWRVLCLLKPFFAIFSYDTLSHVRINHVKENLLKYFRANHQFLDKATIKSFNDHFLDPLKKKKSTFNLSSTDLKSFLPLTPLKWPADLSTIGIREEEKVILEKAFLKVLPKNFKTTAPISSTKQKTIYGTQHQLPDSNNKKLDIPLKVKINIQSQKKESYIYLWTKQVIAEGGQRKIKKCYDLLTGKVVVRKKCCSRSELLVLQHFQKNRSLVGIEPIKSIEENKYIIQDLFPGTLSQLIENNSLNFKKVCSIMHQLALGLTSLHSLEETRNSTASSSETRKFNAFHSDIKPDNILIRKSAISGNWEVFISDFGIVNQYSPGDGTIGYLSPEDVKLKCKVFPTGRKNPRANNTNENEIENLVNSYGQKKDVWALGLVFLHLVSSNFYVITTKKNDGTTIKKGVSPLKCVTEAVRKGPGNGHPSFFAEIRNGHPDALVAELEQKDVDQDIEEAKQNSNKIYAPIFDKLLSLMLQVDPEKRISAKEALEICSGLKMV